MNSNRGGQQFFFLFYMCEILMDVTRKRTVNCTEQYITTILL